MSGVTVVVATIVVVVANAETKLITAVVVNVLTTTDVKEFDTT